MHSASTVCRIDTGKGLIQKEKDVAEKMEIKKSESNEEVT
jgi:hypothetical protein